MIADRDDLAQQLAKYDEQLRDGTDPNLAEGTTIDGPSVPQLAPLVDCLRLLERAWPRTSGSENSPLPKEIGRFQLDRVLGVGGFGIVYKAYDPVLRRDVALKVPRLHALAMPHWRERFEREARAAASLDHPNIVPIHETGQAGPVYYIAAAYCPGQNLAEWLKSQTAPVPFRLAATLTRKIAEAVQYSHSQGVLHRDLKPSNVMLFPVESAGLVGQARSELPFVPRLTDFGVAKLVADDVDGSTLGVSTLVMGTPAYMAPEQTGKLDFPIGSATDVYGLGVILFELLTGGTPFQGTNQASVFDQIRHTEPVGPRQLRPEIPRELETICLKCLEKKPTRRFKTSQELAEELGRFLRGEPITSRPVSPIERSLRWLQRKPMAAALMGVSILAVIAIVGLLAARDYSLTKYNEDVTNLNRELTQAANHARELQQIAEKSESTTKDALYAADINRAAAAWKSEDTLAMIEFLDRHVPKPGESDRRGFEWWYLRGQAYRSHRVLLEIGSAIYALCPSPDRQLIAAAGFDATVRLFDPQTGTISREIATGQTEVNGIAFSPDGKELATSGDDGTIRVWDLASGTQRLDFRAHPGKAFQLFFRPDGQEIVSSGDNPVIRIFDAKTGQKRGECGHYSGEVHSLVLDRNGESFATTHGANPGIAGTALLWDINTYERKKPVSIASLSPLRSVVVREDRDWMIVSAREGKLISIRLSENKFINMVQDLENAESLALHPKGELLAAGYRFGRIRFWNVSSTGELTPNQIQPWQAHQGQVYSLLWSDDGSSLVSAGHDGRVVSWSRSAIESPNPRRLETNHHLHFCVVPNTDYLAILEMRAAHDATILLNRRTGVRVAEIDDKGLNEITASSDGRYVASLRRNPGYTDFYLLQVDNSVAGSVGLTQILAFTEPGELQCLRFSPDSKSIAVSQHLKNDPEKPADHFIWIREIPNLESKKRIPIPNAKAMCYSADGRRLALAAGAGLTLWDLDSQCVVWEQPQIHLSVLTFSPDGQLVVTGGDDRLVVVRNSHDGSVRFRLAGHRAPVRQLTFSPDNRTLATSDDNHIVKLWSVAAGQELMEMSHLADTAGEMEFSSDRSQFLLKVHFWDKQKEEILIFDGVQNGLLR